MSNARYVEKLASGPWLCDQEHVEFLHSIYLGYMERVANGRPLDRQAVEQTLGRPLDNTRAVTVQNGVARIPVVGTIVRRAGLFSDISGGVSTEAIAKDFATAYNDAMVHSILFVFDSPGGEATGVNELASAIGEKRDLGEKRIEAYCDGDCASGAYWLASATSFITTDPTSALGSIGVVSRVRNPESAGRKLTLEFWNSRSPKKRLDPNSYEGQAAIQEYIDDMGDEFIRAVADNRGVSFEEVERDFGQGFVMIGRKAVQVGLADALGSEEAVMLRLQAGRSPGREPETAARREEPERQPERPPAAVIERPGEAPWAALLAAKDNEKEEQLRSLETNRQDEPEREPEERDSAQTVLGRIRALVVNAHVTAGPLAASETMANLESTTNEGGAVRLETRDGAAVLVADSGEELTLTAEARDALVAEVAQERDTAREEAEDLRGRMESLSASDAEKARQLTEARVDHEISAFAGEGVPPYMLDAARPDLVEAEASPGDEAATARAERWRSTLGGARGTVEYGERGVADGVPDASLSDHERVQLTLTERRLGMEHYEAVAGELAASGQIRREE